MPEPLVIEVVSDVVCPWCYVGKKRLEAALREAGGAQVRWRPFQLDPTIPPEGRDRQAYMRAKFGDGPGLAQAPLPRSLRPPENSPRMRPATSRKAISP